MSSIVLNGYIYIFSFSVSPCRWDMLTTQGYRCRSDCRSEWRQKSDARPSARPPRLEQKYYWKSLTRFQRDAPRARAAACVTAVYTTFFFFFFFFLFPPTCAARIMTLFDFPATRLDRARRVRRVDHCISSTKKPLGVA